MQQHSSTKSVLTHTLDSWVGSKVKTRSKYFFTESSMLHFKLKGMEVAHILSLHTLSTPRWCQKVKTFFFAESSHVAYQMKGIGA